MEVRLQKFMADNGVASRRKAEQFILDGRVKVNGVIVSEMGVKVDAEKDQVQVDGKLIEQIQNNIVIMLNKPDGYVCTTRRFKDEKSVLELIDIKERVYPIGRLDKHTTGLLLLTNNGALAQKLTHPKYEKDKEYEVTVNQEVDEVFINSLRSGVELEDGKTFPAKVSELQPNKFSIVLKEGKKRQIRRMCAEYGYGVLKLKRVRVNNLKLSNLALGEYKVLSEEDLKKLA